MGFFDKLGDAIDEFFDDVGDFMDELADVMIDLLNEVMSYMNGWLESIRWDIEEGDLIALKCRKCEHKRYSEFNRNFDHELRKRGLCLTELSGTEEELEAFRKAIAKTETRHQYQIPLTDEEAREWDRQIGNEQRVLQITS